MTPHIRRSWVRLAAAKSNGSVIDGDRRFGTRWIADRTQYDSSKRQCKRKIVHVWSGLVSKVTTTWRMTVTIGGHSGHGPRPLVAQPNGLKLEFRRIRLSSNYGCFVRRFPCHWTLPRLSSTGLSWCPPDRVKSRSRPRD